MNGWSILGICLVVVSLLTIVWGGYQYPVNFLDTEFMSYVVGGLIFATIGLFLISGVPVSVKIVGILLSTASLLLYIYGFEGMDLILKLISFVPVIGFAAWLILKVLN
ncbi:hypothetical protein [Enterococcus olivae]